MSIALSVVVHPSRLVRRVLVAYGSGQIALAAALWAGWAGPVGAGRFVAAACVAAGLLALGRACRNGTAQRIDISGTGELRVTVQQKTDVPPPAFPLRLETGSTLWSRLLCLGLVDGDGRRRILLVAPDSVTPEQFRALAATLRSIAGRDNVFFEKNKIV